MSVKIRSITYFFEPSLPMIMDEWQKSSHFIHAACELYTHAGYEVQTVRLATDPFPNLLERANSVDLSRIAQDFEGAAKTCGYEYISLGPALPRKIKNYSLIENALAVTKNVFFGGLMTLPDGVISLPAVRSCAEVIHQTAALSVDGFSNLRFAALANVEPGSPFLPAAYHAGGGVKFALATESAGLAVEAFSNASSLDEARKNLISAMEEKATDLCKIAYQLGQEFKIEFGGIDFSLAPFPDERLSLGKALECLGVPALGLHGSLAAAAFLTDTMDRAEFPRVGFNGLMLPVLEDAVLAKRTAEGTLSIKDLLLYSSVCGIGLDTLPLPGDISIEQLYAILLDVASLALRLNKPLTARLMPIPGKKAGDPTDFDFAYFANSRVMEVNSDGLRGLLGGEEIYNIRSRG